MPIDRLHRTARHTFVAAATAMLAIITGSTPLAAQCFNQGDFLPCNRPSATDKPTLLVEGNNLHVFVKGTDNALWHRLRTGTDAMSPWSRWESLGGALLSGASASFRTGTPIMDVFARGGGNHLYHLTRTGGSFSSWEDMGGNIDSDPASVSWAANRIDVFARNATTKGLDHLFSNGAGWLPWESLGGGLAGGPTVASWAPNRLDVFVAGGDTYMYHKMWTGTSTVWSEYESLGCCIIGTPTVYTAGPNTLFVTALGTDSRIFAQSYSGAWSGWKYEMSTWSATSSPAIAYYNGITEIVAMGPGNMLMRKVSNGPGTWAAWQPLMAGPYLSDITVSSNTDYNTAAGGCAPGYVPLLQDLNTGAGGDYIFLCLQWGSDRTRAIYNVGIQMAGSGGTNCPANYSVLSGNDLNKGSGGDYLYLCFTRTASAGQLPVGNLVVQMASGLNLVKAIGGENPLPCSTGENVTFGTDPDRQGNLNAGALKGQYIVACMVRATS